jgi:hypothetical protein
MLAYSKVACSLTFPWMMSLSVVAWGVAGPASAGLGGVAVGGVVVVAEGLGDDEGGGLEDELAQGGGEGGAAFCALVTISSAGVTSRMSHNAASTGRDSRSGVPVTRRCTLEADSVMPRPTSYGTSPAVVNIPRSDITLRSRHR